MGTAVLSPQDCLGTQRTRYNQPIIGMGYSSARSAPKPKRKGLQASTQKRHATSSDSVSSSYAHDDEFKGLLPLPSNRSSTGYVPVASESSFTRFLSPAPFSSSLLSSSKQPSHRCARSSSSSAALYTGSAFLPPRSSSSGPSLRTWHAHGKGHGGERSHSLNGLPPLGLVQANGMGRRAAHGNDTDIPHMQENLNASRFSDPSRFQKGGVTSDDITRNRFSEKKLHSEDDHVGGIRKRTQGNVRNGSFEGDNLSKPPSTHVDPKKVGKRRLADKVIAAKTFEERDLRARPSLRPDSVVTILQRPQTKEAALELLGKFSWKVEGHLITGDEEEDGEKRNVIDSSSAIEHEEASKTITKCVSDARSMSHMSDSAFIEGGQMASGRISSSGALISQSDPKSIRGGSGSSENETWHREASECLPSGLMEALLLKDSPCKNEMRLEEDPVGFSFFGPPVPLDERWAGPAYAVSPPPSSLPFPKFSMRQTQTSSPELVEVGECPTGNLVELVLPGTQKDLPSPPYRAAMPQADSLSCENGMDVAFATLDLRRILNLDSY